MSADAAIEHMEWIVGMLNRDLFGGRLPQFRVRWHSSDTDTLGSCNPASRTITLRRNIESMPRSWLAQVIVHELCHGAVAGERVDHGPRWVAAMRLRGVEPTQWGGVTGMLVPNGPLCRWLEARGW